MSRSNFIQNYFESTFSFDLRSLALFRICLGSLIIVDLAFRWPTLVDMYTGEGFFTQELSFQYFQNQIGDKWSDFIWSVYWLSDSVAFATSLFAVATIAALLLIVGKWTKMATIVSWLLLASLHVRNPLVTSSGDFMFKMMLFWSVFLPLSAKWSMDSISLTKKSLATKNSLAINNNDHQSTYFAIATIAYVIQLFAIYFFPGIAKWNDIWLSGDAMSYVMRLDIYIRQFGRTLLNYPELLSFTSWITLAAEVFLIWTLFCSWKNSTFRLANMIVFCAFHIGIALSLGIGLFPWICIVAWIPLLPSFIWGSNRQSPGLISKFDWRKLSTRNLLSEIFCLFALLIVVVWNVSNIEHPVAKGLRIPIVEQLGYQLAVDQHFQMFGVPPAENPWFVYEGNLSDGKSIDLWGNDEVDVKRPDSGLKAFPNFHWRKMHRNALHPANKFVRQSLLDYRVKKWNSEYSDKDLQIAKARLICFREEIGPEYNELNFYSDVWGAYEDKTRSAGSLFESFLKEQDDEMSF